MEIPEISIIGGFESGMNFLKCPSFISQFCSHLGIQKVPQMYSFCKWGALILAFLATFTTIINTIKLFLIRVRTVKPLSSYSQPLLQLFHDDDDVRDDDDSSLASLDHEETEPTTSFTDQKPVDEDFRVAGSCLYGGKFNLRRKRSYGNGFSWSDFVAGESVVKLWDSLSFGLDFEDCGNNGLVSMLDLNTDKKISSFFCRSFEFPATSMSSAAVVLSAQVDNKSNAVVLGAHDMRVGHRNPAIYAEWKSQAGNVVGLKSGGVEKVYVSDGVNGVLTVGDMRNVKTPLERLTETLGGRWDADAVIFENELVDYSR